MGLLFPSLFSCGSTTKTTSEVWRLIQFLLQPNVAIRPFPASRRMLTNKVAFCPALSFAWTPSRKMA